MSNEAHEPESPVLQAVRLSKHFPVRGMRSKDVVHAVDDVNLEMRRGRVLALVGESGSGKSTIARLLAQLMPATGGRILLPGDDAVTQALAAFKGASDDATRAEAMQVIQDAFVNDAPGLVIWSRPAVAQYSTVNYTGFPTAEDPYANPQPTGPQAALILSKLTPTE